MLLRAFLVSILLMFGVSGAPGAAAASGIAVAETVSTTVPDDDTTRPTISDFYPDERPLSDCLSSLPKPDCGSKARGGWHQTIVFLLILVGFAVIAWRIVATSRKARGLPSLLSVVRSRRTPDSTSAPGDDGDAPAP